MVFWWVPYLAKRLRSDFNNGQMKDTSVQAPHLWSSGGCHIWLKASGLTLIMVQGITRTVAAF